MGWPQLVRTFVERDELAGRFLDGPLLVGYLGRRELDREVLERTQLV